MSIAESTRQVLNKSIDLLHKLSNKKLPKEEIKQQLSNLLSNYFFAVYPDSNQRNFGEVDDGSKIKMELFLEQANEIVEKVASGKAPLYEAIMLMNKVVVNHQPDIDEVQPSIPHQEAAAQPINEPALEAEAPAIASPKQPKVEPVQLNAEEPGMVIDEFDPSSKQLEKQFQQEKVSARFKQRTSMHGRSELQGKIGALLGDVLKKHEELDASILALNDSLKEIGFEIKPLH